MLKVKQDTPVEPDVLAVLEQVRAVSAALGIPYFMIGARAIDVHLHNVHGLPTFHPTNDTDFAVAVESWEDFAALKSGLAGTGHFKPDARRAHRLYFDEAAPIDLVPFGGLESPRGSIAWPPGFDQVMTVRCFAEINSAAEEIEIHAGLTLRAASVPGLMLLKLFAWNDRRERKDAWNIASLLQSYEYVVDGARIFADEDLYKSVAYDAKKAGAALLGRDAAAIVTAPILTLFGRLSPAG
jgi:predicted nucleotidyltransferase